MASGHHELIASDRVEGTSVFSASGGRIGSIERIMLEKASGNASYVVLSFGGFLGIGHDHYPLPWQALTYNTALGGYQTAITEDQLKAAPKYDPAKEWDWGDRERSRTVHEYYHIPFPGY